MNAIGIVLGALLSMTIVLLTLVGKAVVWSAKRATPFLKNVVRPSLKTALDRALPAAASFVSSVGGQDKTGASRPKDAALEPSDRIFTVEFDEGWKAVVYINTAQGVARRFLKPNSRDELQRMRYTLNTFRTEMDPVDLPGLKAEEILMATEAEGPKLIAELRRRMASVQYAALHQQQKQQSAPSAQAAQAEEQSQPAQPAQPAADVNVPVKHDVQPGPAVMAAQPAKAGPRSPFVPSGRLGKIGAPIEGVVLEAGEVSATFGDGQAGTTFQVRVRTKDDEKEMRGAMLREEFKRQGIQAGDRVRITPQGRSAAVDGSGAERRKNLFEVVLLEKANALGVKAA